jgi:Tol biopolymer transport system component
MTQRSSVDFDQLMAAWIRAEAPEVEPAGLLDRVLDRTRHTRRTPAWLLSERWIPDRVGTPFRGVPRLAAVVVVLALILALVTAALLAGGFRHRPPAPFGPATNGRLAFDTNAQILTANADGSDVRPLVLTIPNAAGATFSPDGTKLAFWGDGSPDSLYLANADGTAIHKLAGDLWISTDKSPTWSPDSRAIALSTEGAPQAFDEHLLVIDTTTGIVKNLGPAPALPVRALFPTWSPDGQWISFEGIGPTPSYWLVRPDGTDAHRLPTGLLEDTVFPARWAPSASTLQLAYSASAPSSSGSEIYVFDLATNSERRISGDHGRELWPTWSPDGTRLAWLTGAAREGVRIQSIADPSTAVTLEAAGMAFPPTWSPDGTRLYALDEERTSVIVITVDGSSPTVRIPHTGSQAVPDWQRLGP